MELCGLFFKCQQQHPPYTHTHNNPDQAFISNRVEQALLGLIIIFLQQLIFKQPLKKDLMEIETRGGEGVWEFFSLLMMWSKQKDDYLRQTKDLCGLLLPLYKFNPA